MEAVIAGEEFGKIYTGSGQAEPLISPMTGKVIDLNHNANTAMSALIRDNLSEGWLLVVGTDSTCNNIALTPIVIPTCSESFLKTKE